MRPSRDCGPVPIPSRRRRAIGFHRGGLVHLRLVRGGLVRLRLVAELIGSEPEFESEILEGGAALLTIEEVKPALGTVTVEVGETAFAGPKPAHVLGP